MVNEDRLIYSIIREIQNGHKIYSDEQNEGTILKSDMFVDNKYIYDGIIKKMENVYMYKKYTGNKYIKIAVRDLKREAFEFLRNHSELSDSYPGLSNNLKEWIQGP